MRDIVDTKAEDWDTLIDVNLKGPFFFCKHVVKQMLKQDGGSIVNIGSDLGVVGLASCTAYCASKGAVVNFTRALALEYAKNGIRVNCVCPCSVETPMFMGALKEASEKIGYEKAREDFLSPIPLGRFGNPLAIAQAVLYLTSDQASYVTGSILMCDGGKTAH